jgi:hypothetical protein
MATPPAYHGQYSESNKARSYKRNLTAQELLHHLLPAICLESFDSVLDHGYGDGSLLRLISSSMPGLRLFGYEVDPSAEKAVFCYPELRECTLFNSFTLPSLPSHGPGKLLGISSHVLEHVTSPRQYITDCLSITPYWLFVVPLEHTLSLPRKTATLASIGHINIYTASTLSLLFGSCGVDAFQYSSLPSLEYHCALYGPFIGAVKYLIKNPFNLAMKCLQLPLLSTENAYVFTKTLPTRSNRDGRPNIRL